MRPPLSTSCLILAPFALLVIVFVLPSLRPPQVGSDGSGVLYAHRATTNIVAIALPQETELSLLIGVLTMPRRRERRDIVRLAYALQPRAMGTRVDIRFMFCDVIDPMDAALVALEIKRHGDILGTSHHHPHRQIRHRLIVSTRFLPPSTSPMTTHTCAWRRSWGELRAKPHHDLYLGRGFPVGDDPMPFMHGMGYVLSWDVEEWVSGNREILWNNDTHGHEDRLLGKWLNLAGRGKNRYDLKPRMYDVHWDVDNFRPDTIAVHRLKDSHRWAAAFRYFNVTAGITPSKLCTTCHD
ncbi:hypothetical protein BAE44_0006877 [Dichanthelium oligosanthes]|uniref:Hexosyltransferase n=1 Tax=Dichanthelium oligosanthes TaxID=888268 RepID=A0A1E5W3Z2_9POAL|nr:hypothetical protein BAE44_0006877 [Dichanthelium oligosanthes]